MEGIGRRRRRVDGLDDDGHHFDPAGQAVQLRLQRRAQRGRHGFPVPAQHGVQGLPGEEAGQQPPGLRPDQGIGGGDGIGGAQGCGVVHAGPVKHLHVHADAPEALRPGGVGGGDDVGHLGGMDALPQAVGGRRGRGFRRGGWLGGLLQAEGGGMDDAQLDHAHAAQRPGQAQVRARLPDRDRCAQALVDAALVQLDQRHARQAPGDPGQQQRDRQGGAAGVAQCPTAGEIQAQVGAQRRRQPGRRSPPRLQQQHGQAGHRGARLGRRWRRQEPAGQGAQGQLGGDQAEIGFHNGHGRHGPG